MNPFSLSSAPLEGANLIEASAGTGKTYTLTGLFLRLLVEQGLRIDQVLVVTYTNAATAELKERIRDGLRKAKSAFKQQDRSDDRLAELMDAVPDINLAIHRINDALVDFDRAAIYTIHGFCQRILQSYAFETGSRFHTELIQDASQLVQQTVDDFWRRYISTAPRELAAFAVDKVGSPERLAEILAYSRHSQIKIIPETEKPSLSMIKQWRHATSAIVNQWADARKIIKELLEYEGLNARYYGKCAQVDHASSLTHRQIRIDALCDALDRWEGQYPLFAQFDRFSTSYLHKATKKGYKAPQHPFFDACETALQCHQAMEVQLAAFTQYLKARLVSRTQRQLAQKKAFQNIQFFDDLLLQVHDALTDKGGPRLVRAVRSQYRAALVDEFQDTDPLQYRIFLNLFAEPPHLLVMIGDPKQAIYGFRGADLFSYIQAVEHADHRATLTRNWRSTPALVGAVNAIFKNQAHPFGMESIHFDSVEAAVTDNQDRLPALNLWYLNPGDQIDADHPISQGEAIPKIVNAVAQEIVDLLGSSSDDFFPEDIAVLTRSHYQSKVMKAALVARKVPAVLHSAGRVFESAEALEMKRLLNASALPFDPLRVRAALCTHIMGADAFAFSQDSSDSPSGWQRRWAAFHTYHKLWNRFGFYRMFRQIMAREGVKVRLLALPEGERRMTNILHLAELLHQAETDQKLGPEGLVKWLDSNCHATEKGGQDQQLRLESDSCAVKIITMHKSKGLQFKVVFCPFTWSGINVDDSAVVFHHKDEADALTLSLGPTIDPEHKLQAQKEMLAENLRLLYVALTRAQQRCYWVWGRIKGTQLSAPAYLLHLPGAQAAQHNWISALEKKMSGLTHDDFVNDLRSLAESAHGSIGVVPLPQPKEPSESPVKKAMDNSVCGRVMNRKIADAWRIASFSSMTAGLEGVGHQRNWDDRDAGDSASNIQMPVQRDADTLFAFPKGIQAGLFFHDLLERWVPDEADTPKHKALIAELLGAYGLETHWIPCIDHMLKNLARVPLKDTLQTFSLQQIHASNRLYEMEFHFRLRRIDARQIQRAFEQYADKDVNLTLKEVWTHLHFDAVQGFLKGFIDMCFRFKKRYYLIDWKSNYLGQKHEDYGAQQLTRNLAQNYYFLQYHLYTVAMDQLLRNRLPGYDYQRDFGGVFYIYLRGIQADLHEPTGVFYDLPTPELIGELNRLMIAN